MSSAPNYSPGVMKYVEAAQKLLAERDAALARMKTMRFDTIAVHGLYTVEEALNRNQGAVIEPLYLSTSQAYADSDELEAALAYLVPTWCYTRIANPTTYYLEWVLALLEGYRTGCDTSCCVTASGMSRHHVGRRSLPGQAEGRPGADQLRLLHPGLRRHLPAFLPPQDEGAGHRVPLGPAPLGHRGLEVADRRGHPLPLHGDALEPPAVVRGRQGARRPGPLLGHPAHHRRHLRHAGPDAAHRPRGRHRRPFADQVDHLGRLRHRRGAHQPQAHHHEDRERPSPVQGELRRIRQVPALPGQRAGLRRRSTPSSP